MTKLPAKVLSLLQEQLTVERNASAAYSAMAAALSVTAFQGFAKWLQTQAQEEYGHFEGFFDYLVARNAKPEVAATEGASFDFKDPLEAFKAALELEVEVTRLLNELCDAAEAESDKATYEFLLPYIKEQAHAERELQDIILKLELASSDVSAVLFLDHEINEQEEN